MRSDLSADDVEIFIQKDKMQGFRSIKPWNGPQDTVNLDWFALSRQARELADKEAKKAAEKAIEEARDRLLEQLRKQKEQGPVATAEKTPKTHEVNPEELARISPEEKMLLRKLIEQERSITIHRLQSLSGSAGHMNALCEAFNGLMDGVATGNSSVPLTPSQIRHLREFIKLLKDETRSLFIEPVDPEKLKRQEAEYYNNMIKMEEQDKQDAQEAVRSRQQQQTRLLIVAGVLGVTAAVTAIVMIVRKKRSRDATKV